MSETSAVASTSEAEPGSSAGEANPQVKYAERMKRLRDLHLRRNEARKLNNQEVIEEDKRLKLPANWEAKKRRTEWYLREEEQKKEAESRGEEYTRVKLLEMGADEAERWDRKKKKKNPDPGFSNFEAATVRQYNRLVKNIKPDMEEYARERERLGDAFYASRNTILHGMQKDSKEAIDRMAEDVERQIDKRQKYSRRRMHNDDADIDYINERNMKFNKKLERFYGQYTSEIKQNLERGTAV